MIYGEITKEHDYIALVNKGTGQCNNEHIKKAINDSQ